MRDKNQEAIQVCSSHQVIQSLLKMSAALVASFLLALAVHAKVLPRQGSARTLTVPVPTQGEPFTTTVSGCGGSVDPFVVIGAPTGTFSPGTVTIYLPPQAEATSTTYFDKASNATEVILLPTLPGDCLDYPFPTQTSPTTGTESPTPSAEACPEKGCSGQVVKSGKLIIDAINQVTFLSQNLQSSAKLIGGDKVGKRDETETAIALGPIDDVARGLTNIATTLSSAAPKFVFLPPLPPDCNSDTVVIALIQFVRVHQALLNILIGRAGLLENGPIKRDASYDGSVQLYERANNAFVGKAIATALRAVERIVDTVAARLIDLIPTKSECAKQQKAELDASLKEAITSYDG